MDKDSRDKRFIRKPIFPGGEKAYKSFIAQNLVYPDEAKKNNIEGQVRLKYGISYKGEVTEVKVLNSVGYGCDEEAVRIVKLLKFDVPKGPRKLRVLFHKTVRINFKMKRQKAKESKKKAPAVSYNYVSTTENQKQTKKQQSGYVYRITIK